MAKYGAPFKMKGSPMQRNFGIGASPMRDEKSDKKDANREEGKVNKEGTAVWRGGKWVIYSPEQKEKQRVHNAANTPEQIAKNKNL